MIAVALAFLSGAWLAGFACFALDEYDIRRTMDEPRPVALVKALAYAVVWPNHFARIFRSVTEE